MGFKGLIVSTFGGCEGLTISKSGIVLSYELLAFYIYTYIINLQYEFYVSFT